MDGHDHELRRLRLEAREQLEEAEAAALELSAATRTLGEALLDAGRQGRSVAVETGSIEIRGHIDHAEAELIQLTSVDGRSTSIVIEAMTAVHVVANGTGAKRVGRGHPQTIEALLREWVQTPTEVEIGRTQGRVVRGRVRCVTPTHVEVLDSSGDSWMIPHPALAWVRRI